MTKKAKQNHYNIKKLDLAEKIRLSILARGWTYSGVAKALGVKCAAITYWCNGESKPTKAHKKDLITLFNTIPLPSFTLKEKDFEENIKKT